MVITYIHRLQRRSVVITYIVIKTIILDKNFKVVGLEVLEVLTKKKN